MRISLLLFIMLTTACAQNLPATHSTISQTALDAPYPKLVPIDQLIAKAKNGSKIVAQTKTLEARVARLKNRAAALKGRSVFDGATRLKLLQAARRNADRTAS